MNFLGQTKEQHIIRLFQKGDARAMDELYEEYADYLAGVCSRYIPNKEDLHDVLQESFIKVFTKVSSFKYRGEGSLKAWITRIGINESLHFLRNNATGLTLKDTIEAIDVTDDEPSFDGLTENEILELIAKLPTGYRTVFNLYVIEGASHKEIAELLDIKPDSSASQFHKAKAMLAKMITDYRKKKN